MLVLRSKNSNLEQFFSLHEHDLAMAIALAWQRSGLRPSLTMWDDDGCHSLNHLLLFKVVAA